MITSAPGLVSLGRQRPVTGAAARAYCGCSVSVCSDNPLAARYPTPSAAAKARVAPWHRDSLHAPSFLQFSLVIRASQGVDLLIKKRIVRCSKPPLIVIRPLRRKNPAGIADLYGHEALDKCTPVPTCVARSTPDQSTDPRSLKPRQRHHCVPSQAGPDEVRVFRMRCIAAGQRQARMPERRYFASFPPNWPIDKDFHAAPN